MPARLQQDDRGDGKEINLIATANGSWLDQNLAEQCAESESHQNAADVSGVVDADARGAADEAEEEVVSDKADRLFSVGLRT